jgi:hypothetical protein
MALRVYGVVWRCEAMAPPGFGPPRCSMGPLVGVGGCCLGLAAFLELVVRARGLRFAPAQRGGREVCGGVWGLRRRVRPQTLRALPQRGGGPGGGVLQTGCTITIGVAAARRGALGRLFLLPWAHELLSSRRYGFLTP